METKKRVPDFIAKAVKTVEGKDIWSDVGVAYVGKESITVLANAWPVGDKLVLMKPREREEKPKEKMDPFNRGGGVVGDEPKHDISVLEKGV
jgi:hypothetical protein